MELEAQTQADPEHQARARDEAELELLPAALEQAFVVLTAIIGLLTAGYAASLRRAVRRPECDICVRLRPRIAILCHEKIACRFVQRIRNLFLAERV